MHGFLMSFRQSIKLVAGLIRFLAKYANKDLAVACPRSGMMNFSKWSLPDPLLRILEQYDAAISGGYSPLQWTEGLCCDCEV